MMLRDTLVFLISLIFTGLAIIDGTSLLVAVATIMFPFVAGKSHPAPQEVKRDG
ncbi:hypothetical protein [Thermococcus celer]|uniref:hypothetical protein n=1 Tax=Thermococcus celer TaxID=2264 RepID=UPI000ADD9249|nr:hypothetical protein [Thermococcus celer]